MEDDTEELPLFYFNAAQAVRIHDWLIEHSGGRAGIKDRGVLGSTLEHIQNDLYYPSFEARLTHLVFAINKFHPFTDGNKRSSIALGAYFLKLNGFGFLCEKIRYRNGKYRCLAG